MTTHHSPRHPSVPVRGGPGGGTGTLGAADTVKKRYDNILNRELSAVHSEHEKNMSSDSWRLDQLNKSTADPKHPYHKFGTGKSLMAMVVPLFSAVRDGGVTAPSWPDSPFPPALRRKRAYTAPPGHYLSHLLGHEGPGSLLSALKARGWCNRIGARGFGFFGVQVDLTEDGVEHIDDIITLVFQYISMMREQGAQRWVWEEQRDLMAMEFRFKDVQEPRSLVVSHEFPMEDVLSAYYIVSEWRPELIDELLSMLTPENVRVGVEWQSVKPIKELYLPPPNEFIPSKLLLEKAEESTRHTPNEVVPFAVCGPHIMQPDVSVGSTPEGQPSAVRIRGRAGRAEVERGQRQITIEGYDDKQHVLLDKIMEHMVNFKADPQRFEIMKENHIRAIRNFEAEQPYQNQHVLLDKIIEHMVNFKADPQRFVIMKETHIRAIKNFEAEQPYQHAVYQQALCLSDLVWTRCQLLDSAAERMMKSVHIEALMFGNLSRQRALQIANNVESKETRNSVHKSSCASLYYACGVREARPNVALELLAQTLSEPCFNILRTQFFGRYTPEKITHNHSVLGPIYPGKKNALQPQKHSVLWPIYPGKKNALQPQKHSVLWPIYPGKKNALQPQNYSVLWPIYPGKELTASYSTWY
ncbi:Insulin-degrading enzyme, partial [Operophtera brumata]